MAGGSRRAVSVILCALVFTASCERLAMSAEPVTGCRKCSVPEHSSTAFRSQAMRLSSVSCCQWPVSLRGTRRETEDAMRLLTYLELSRYSRRELQELLNRLRRVLPHLPPGSSARETALLNIHHVRIFIARLGRRHRLQL
jgi:hypothetical protein